MSHLRVALCQLDTVVGDVAGNAARIVDALRRSEDDGADIVAFPELAITGYPPEDLLLKPSFVAENLAALERVAGAPRACLAVVGFVDVTGGDDIGDAVAHASGAGVVAREAALRGAPRRLRNAVALCVGGDVLGVYHKRRLPNYGVFDEERWFAPGSSDLELYQVAGALVGVSICEDAWFPRGPVCQQGLGGAALVVNVNASPYSMGRSADRFSVVGERVKEAGCAIAYVNQVGGQDELVFDGGSFVMDAAGEVLAAAPCFTEDTLVVDVPLPAAPAEARLAVVPVSSRPRSETVRPAPALPAGLDEEDEVYEALVLGTRDYLHKNGFTDAVIGLSGGIDSSLVAAVAVDALGAEHVHGMAMPSRYSSAGSVSDATALAERLGMALSTVPIETAHRALTDLLAPVAGGGLGRPHR